MPRTGRDRPWRRFVCVLALAAVATFFQAMITRIRASNAGVKSQTVHSDHLRQVPHPPSAIAVAATEPTHGDRPDPAGTNQSDLRKGTLAVLSPRRLQLTACPYCAMSHTLLLLDAFDVEILTRCPLQDRWFTIHLQLQRSEHPLV